MTTEASVVGLPTSEGVAPALSGTSGPTAAEVVRETVVVTLLALLVAIGATWPLAANLPTMAENVADAPFQAWTIDHVQWAITGGGPVWDAPIFAPNENTLAYSDSLFGVAVPLLPLRWLGVGPLAQLNIALLLGSATSAGGGYLFGRVVSGRRTVGAVTAAVFAFGAFGTASMPTSTPPCTSAWRSRRQRPGGWPTGRRPEVR